jgi:putative Holliday junction resolvase
MPGTPETVLALDFGRRRIGVAVGQTVTNSANPLGIVANSDDGPDWAQFAALISEWRPARLIVGMPAHADGTRSEICAHVEQFIIELHRFELPVVSQDERFTSLEAEQQLKNERARGVRGRISKELIDSTSAVLIAERWLGENN